MFVTMLPVIDLINSGKLGALAVIGPQRVPAVEDVPTVVEEGFPNLVTEDFVGFAVKSGTPDHVVAVLNRGIDKALADPKVRESFARVGAMPAGRTPAEYGDFVKSQVGIWNGVVRDFRNQAVAMNRGVTVPSFAPCEMGSRRKAWVGGR